MIGANNVRQALDYVARAEVDAGFVYATDAALMPDKVKVALTVPTTTAIVYPVAPLAAATFSTKAGILVMTAQEREARLSQIRAFLASRPETAEGEFILPMATAVLRTTRP